ncbi:MAG: hypothetical protein JWR51_4653 [Devosia sp.]|uniref:hypothetical protein n=1 Tax=Devosia sp. TaxID=1871048 RepID=UPI00260E4587|nr:hypothetical protein [Devosia sp.]MDB5531550.1 hypothetical protein [Devosia sp.]
MAIWICRLLPWALFVPSILWVPSLEPGWCFLLGIVNGGFACFCGTVADDIKRGAR